VEIAKRLERVRKCNTAVAFRQTPVEHYWFETRDEILIETRTKKIKRSIFNVKTGNVLLT